MLQFVLSSVQHDADKFFIEKIKEDSRHQQEVFYLVPDHIKFDAEMNVMRGLGVGDIRGNLHVQVYSFSRLAWYFLKDTAALSQVPISKIGQTMLIRYILETHQQDLVLFRAQVKKSGFVSYLLQTFTELRQGNITADDLKRLVTQLPHKELKEKLTELHFLYSLFEEGIKSSYIEKEEIYNALIHYLEHAELSHVKVYLNGFDYFNAKEVAIVNLLMQKAQAVIIHLPISKYDEKYLEDKNPLYYVGCKTYQQFLNFAKQNQVKVFTDIKLDESYRNPFNSQMIDILNYWETIYTGNSVLPIDKIDVQQTLTIKTYASKQAEINAVAKEISYLVASGQYRYQDIQVLMRQVEDYEDLIQAIFKESHLPYFMDNADTMAKHSLYELIESIYFIQKRNFKYFDVMRLLKTHLISIDTPEQIDLFDNFILKEGFNRLSHYQTENFDVFDTLKNQFLAVVLPYFEQLDQAETMRDGVLALYEFLITHQVDRALLLLREQFIEQGMLQKAKEQEQVWQTFMNLLDEFVEILGHQPFDFELFYTVILDNFKQAEYSLVPSSLDEVKISSMDSKRADSKKITFAIGLHDSSFPKLYQDTALLSSQEKAVMQEWLTDTQYLNMSVTDRIVVEPMIAYQLLASSTDRLYLLNSVNSTQKESPYVTLLTQRFIVNTQMYAYGRLHQTMRQVLKQIRQNNFTEQVKTLSHYLQEHIPDYQYLFSSFNYTNLPKNLTPTIVEQLYKDNTIVLSISQLESYFKDPYSHFLKYGLKLSERQSVELSPIDVGNVYHYVLDHVFQTLLQKQITIQNMSKEALNVLTEKIISDCFKEPMFYRFNRSETMKFTTMLLSQTLLETVHTLRDYSAQLDLHTISTEMVFNHEHISPLTVGHKNILLRGKIDRVDVVNGKLLSVVDYKSSDRTFDLGKLYDGVSLQLLTYLYAMANSMRDKQLFGAYYYHVQNKYVEQKNIMSDIESNRSKFKGLMIQPSETIEHLESVFDVKKFKSSQKMTVISAQELMQLFEFLKMKITQAGNQLLQGHIPLRPMKDEPYIDALTTYRSISLFDSSLPDNFYQLPTKSDDFMRLIQSKIGEHK